MRCLIATCLALHIGGACALGMDHNFLRIHNPVENERYGLGANIAVNGYLLCLPVERKLEDVTVRVRLYRPVNGRFEIEQEASGEITAPLPDAPGTLQFHGDLKRNKRLQPGQYMVRVDCLQKSDEGSKLLASNCVFLTAVDTLQRGRLETRARPRSSSRALLAAHRHERVPRSDRRSAYRQQ